MPRGDETYTPELAEMILGELASGKSLRRICRESQIFPAEATVRSWATEDYDGFSARYARAKEQGLDSMLDETLDIADDGQNDFLDAGDGKVRFDREAVSRSELRVKTRQWYMKVTNPNKFGDKTDVTTGGEKIAAPSQSVVLNSIPTEVLKSIEAQLAPYAPESGTDQG